MMELSALLRGTWSFRRRVLQAAGEELLVLGTASWTPCAPEASLHYQERGVLSRPNTGASHEQPYTADVHQAYTWHLRNSSSADVHFSDGRFFHALTLAEVGGPACTVTHDCAPDRYEGSWAVQSRDAGEGGRVALVCEWRVSGPGKSYTSSTRYWRPADAAAAESS